MRRKGGGLAHRAVHRRQQELRCERRLRARDRRPEPRHRGIQRRTRLAPALASGHREQRLPLMPSGKLTLAAEGRGALRADDGGEAARLLGLVVPLRTDTSGDGALSNEKAISIPNVQKSPAQKSFSLEIMT